MSRKSSFATFIRSARVLLVVLAAVSSWSPVRDLDAAECGAGRGSIGPQSIAAGLGVPPRDLAWEVGGVGWMPAAPLPDLMPLIQGADEPPAWAESVACTYTPKTGFVEAPCGTCVPTWRCLRRLVTYYRQDCWTCTEPGQSWCNDPVSVGTACFNCFCL
jgi:hypothetical protein